MKKICIDVWKRNSSYNFLALLFFIFISFSNKSHAQIFHGELDLNNPNQEHLIVLKSGEEKVGRIISIENTAVEFLENEKTTPITLYLFDIEKILVSDEDIDAKTESGKAQLKTKAEELLASQRPNILSNHRLFYTETGFTLPQGITEYRTIYGLVHTLDHGVTNGITLGLGFSYPGYVMTHIKFNFIQTKIIPRLRAGLDFQFVAKPINEVNPFNNEKIKGWEGFTRISSYLSYGRNDRFIHLGFSFFPLFDPRTEFFNDAVVTFNFGGTIRVANHWKVVYENNFGGLESFNASNIGLFSGFGVNWFDEKNSIKIAIHANNSNFGFHNFPIEDLSGVLQLPFISYARYF